VCFFKFNKAPKHSTWPEAMEAIGRNSERFEQQLDTATTGEVGILVRPTDDQSHTQTKAEMERALTGMDRTRHHFEVTIDETGHGWAILKDDSLVVLAQGAAQMGDVLAQAGLGERVMAAVFPFRWHDSVNQTDRRIYWLYQPRIRSFTPFVPDGDISHERRDHDLEIRMEAAIRRDLPTERQTAEWFPIWGMPI
jgi:hypothetical protein